MGDDASRSLDRLDLAALSAAVGKLAAEVAADRAARLERQSRMEEIMGGAGAPQAPQPRKRDRHGLHVVRGLALVAAGGTGRWLARTRAHRVLAGGLIMATATGATLAPDMMAPAPAAQVPAHHYHAAVHHRRQPPAPVQPAVPARRTRRRLDSDETARASAPVSPSAPPSPTAAPGPSAAPSPLPSVPVPAPSPDPACTLLHPGKHCHGGDGVSDVARVPGALRGLPGYHDLP